MIEQCGGRKFIFCLLLTILSFVLVLTKSLAPIEWTDFVMVIGGIYVLGNIGATVANGIKKKWMEKEQRYEVICNPHGLLGVVTQAYLGMALFLTHRQELNNCLDVEIELMPEAKYKTQYEISCVSHGLLGVITQAHLGLALFDAHRLNSENCRGSNIRPILKDISFTQRSQMRRITQSGKK